MPLFSSHELHTDLIRALELKVAEVFGTKLGEKSDVDVVVGLESRGFLFGPTLALRLGAGFVPLRKKGKLPGPCETEAFEKEYGADHFQLQSDAMKKGQKVVVVDDIIATGKTVGWEIGGDGRLTCYFRWQRSSSWSSCSQARRRSSRIRFHDGT